MDILRSNAVELYPVMKSGIDDVHQNSLSIVCKQPFLEFYFGQLKDLSTLSH